MFFLVYVSAAVTWFSAAELRALLAASHARNEREGITGMLLYKDGNFMQALEGSEAAVMAVQNRIAHDRRHRGIVTICTGTTETRQFPNWTMGFVDLNADRNTLPSGYSEFLDTPLTEASFANTSSRCLELLGMFKHME